MPAALPPRRGFTLIELLVVIAIIALLVGLLLPGLSRAREGGRAAVCLANVKQIMLGFTEYAGDYKVIPGSYWQGPINLDWCGRNNTTYTSNPAAWRNPFETSVLYDILSGADKIMECPSAQREANNFFDYTMIIRFAGARLDLDWKMTYPVRPDQPAAGTALFPAIPLLIEEHDLFYNHSYDDGSFANLDQFSTRHGAKGTGSAAGPAAGGACTVGYLDGSVAPFKPPAGSSDRTAEPRNLTGNHLRILKKGSIPYPVGSSAATEFGWINKPN